MALSIANSGTLPSPVVDVYLLASVSDMAIVSAAVDLSAITSSGSTFELLWASQVHFMTTNWSNLWRSGPITPDSSAGVTGILTPPIPVGQGGQLNLFVAGANATGDIPWAVYKL